ncbi:MAG: hypothetical protein DRO88_08120 [Promethearchaeia archaeon]|nr:MAG: hypothetical protein DRO88_08120 [Candidatus Lokiarchaeia archaeon]
MEINTLKILSVGIDVGSSTSHLIFSRLTLNRELDFSNKTNRFKVGEREIIYEGKIIFTPLIDENTINIPKLVDFFKKEYENAHITPEMVDTGAVIVTGETAKKSNAQEIVKHLAKTTGKFVSATAGPNFESMLGIMGGGMLEKTKEINKTIMNIDIGGGTSNIAIASQGKVISTSCINVGGRILGIYENDEDGEDFKIWRIDEPAKKVIKCLQMKYTIGDIISKSDLMKIVKELAQALLEVMRGSAKSEISRSLMMTKDIEFNSINRSVDFYSFSGGVAEFIYQIYREDLEIEENVKSQPKKVNVNPFNDIGYYLAFEIYSLIKKYNLKLIEPENKIRATVIGAGAFSLSVSGSTCYYDESIEFPLENIPIVPIDLDYNKFFFSQYHEYFKETLHKALENFNLVEGKDLFAIYLEEWLVQPILTPLAKSLEYSLPNLIKNDMPLLVILGKDGGKVFGLKIKRETTIPKLICLDELDLETGDWVDIGAPLNQGEKKAFPIIKKSLVFKN